MDYLLIKWLHIFSSTILFGTGIGSAFYKWMADRTGNLEHMARTNRNVVLADWLFTTPAVILQPVTGIAMVYMAGYGFDHLWLKASIGLYIVAGLCWLPVVVIQIRMKGISEQALKDGEKLPAIYKSYTRWWFWLGVVAFCSLVTVYYLMVFRPN